MNDLATAEFEFCFSAVPIEIRPSASPGDSEMDSFLRSVGLAIHVANPLLSYEGLLPPLKVKNSSEFGEILFELAAMQRNVIG